MIKIGRIFLIFVISVSINAQKKQGQELIDSLQTVVANKIEGSQKADLYNALFIACIKKDISTAANYAQLQLELSTRIKYNDGIALAKRNLGIVSTTHTDFDAAIQSYKSALTYTNNKKIRGQILGSLGKVYALKSDYPSSLENYNKSLTLFEDLNEIELQKSVLQSISSLYISIGDSEKAREFISKSKQIENQTDSNATTGKSSDVNKENNIINKLNIHTLQEKINPSKRNESFDKNQIDQLSENKNSSEKSNWLMEKACLYIKSQNFEAANNCLYKSLEIEVKRNNTYNIAKIHSILGDVLFKKSETESNKNKLLVLAEKQYDLAIARFKVSKSTKEISDNYKKKSAISNLLGNYKAALESNNLYVKYRDFIFNDTTKYSLKQIEDKREIELRDKQLKINRLELESKEQQKWFYIFGIGLLAVIGGLLFYQSQNRKKTNEKLQLLNTELDLANKTKTRFFSILNHDLRSPVANLIHFLQLQKDSPELLDEETKNRMQDKTISGAEDLLSSMEDILLWSKGQMENFKPQPKNVNVNQLFDDTKKVFSGYIKIRFEYQNLNNIEIFTDENYLKTIIRNLTSNAINIFTNTANPKIIWKAWQENGTSFLSITDNGPGASEAQFKALYDDKEVVGIKSGLGLHLIRDLAKAIDCQVLVVSELEGGTTFTLKF